MRRNYFLALAVNFSLADTQDVTLSLKVCGVVSRIVSLDTGRQAHVVCEGDFAQLHLSSTESDALHRRKRTLL